MEGGKHKSFLVSFNFGTGFGHTRIDLNKPSAINGSLIDEFSQWIYDHILHGSEYADKKAVILNIVPLEDDEAEEHKTREFKVGDVIAYRTLEDNKPAWVAWEIGSMDDNYLYANKERNGGMTDDIAKGSAFLVKAVEDKR